MKTHYIERLIIRSTAKETRNLVRPAITPDVIPEAFPQPVRPHLPLPMTPPVPAEFDVSKRISLEPPLHKITSEPAEADTIPEEISVDEGVETDTAPDAAAPEERKAAADEPTLVSREPPHHKPQQKPTEKPKRSEALEKDAVTRLSAGTKVAPPTQIVPAKERDIQTPKYDEKKVVSTRDTIPKLPRSEILIDQKDRIAGEPVSKPEIPPGPGYLRKLPPEMMGQPRPVGEAQPLLADTYTRTDRLLQEGRSLARLEDYREPSVTINIERVEVRAIMPEKPPVKKEGIPTLSLEEYLKRRREEGQ